MKSKINILILPTFLLVLITSIFNAPVYSQNETLDTPEKVINADKRLKDFCQQEPNVKPKIFPETYIKILSIRKDFCSSVINSLDELQLRVVDLYLDLKILLPDSIPNKIWDIERKRVQEGQRLSIPSVENDPDIVLFYDDLANWVTISGNLFNRCDSIAKGIDNNSNCFSALQEFVALYNYAHGTISQPLAWDLMNHLENLEKQWDNYYEKSKAQTIWEMGLNGYFFQKDNKEHQFMTPPDYQFILMHPGLVVENIPEALDGEHVEEAITLEAVGINYWQQDAWYLPSGAALIGLYSDRIGKEDWGYGIAMYFNNSYTFGVSIHGKKYGYFASVDFLKIIQDKQSTLEEIRGKIDF